MWRPGGETGKRDKWGRLRRGATGSGAWLKAAVPAAEVAGELVVQDASADLEQQVGAARGPAQLLFSTMRLAMTWLTADSVNAVEMASPARWRSPFFGIRPAFARG